MKFDYMSKNKLPSNIIQGRSICKCAVCNALTSYIEINYEGFFCSEECLEKFDEIYFRAEELGRLV